MPENHHDDLAASRIEAFIEHGFLKLQNAFDPELAQACRRLLWQAMRLSPDRPEEWSAPVVRIPYMADSAFVAAANAPQLRRAYDALAGEGRWLSPSGLGALPVRFPSTDDPGDIGWHVDMSYGTENPDFMEWRVNVKSSGRALLMLFLLSDVGVDDAPTLLRKGSHRQIARELLPHGEEGLTLRELSADGFASTADCETAVATGAAGTVYLCHPFLVHSAQRHHGKEPRFLAQPALLPKREFDPALPPSPVQIAIRRACNLRIDRGEAF